MCLGGDWVTYSAGRALVISEGNVPEPPTARGGRRGRRGCIEVAGAFKGTRRERERYMPDSSASVLAVGRGVTQGGRPNFSSPLVGLVNPRSVKLEIPATSRALVCPRGRLLLSFPSIPLPASAFPRSVRDFTGFRVS